MSPANIEDLGYVELRGGDRGGPQCRVHDIQCEIESKVSVTCTQMHASPTALRNRRLLWKSSPVSQSLPLLRFEPRILELLGALPSGFGLDMKSADMDSGQQWRLVTEVITP